MQTYLSLEYAHRTDLPEDHLDEVRTPPALIERFLEAHTDPGDSVFDPFAGFGTTLAVADELDRVPYGLEYEPDRVAYVRERLEDSANVRQGSVLDLDPSRFPSCEMVFTSPPFMEQEMATNPFQNYEGTSSYERYLEDVETAFSRIKQVLSPDGTLVVDVANMKHEGRVTTLAWDVADRISNVLDFQGEVVVTWEGDGPPDKPGSFGYGYDHSYCLVFGQPS